MPKWLDKQLDADFGLPQLCLEKFWSTEAALSLAVLSYNLGVLFQRRLGWLDEKLSGQWGAPQQLYEALAALGVWLAFAAHAHRVTGQVGSWQTIVITSGNVVIRWPTNAAGYLQKPNGKLTLPTGSWDTAGTGSVMGTTMN